jgi:hypothetical protein
MWRIATRQLLIAPTFFGVALAALLIDTKEPYGILVASVALLLAVLSLVNPTSKFARSERAFTVFSILLLVGFLLTTGLAFALLGR